MVENKGVAPVPVDAGSELTHDSADEVSEAMTTPTGKRSTSPAFQFYPNDFLGDPRVQVMSATEVGVYWLLIMACWNEPAGLVLDMRRLSAIARMKHSQFDRMWSGVLHECFDVRADKVFHRRVEKERKKQSAFRKQQKEKADKRWQSHGSATAMPESGARHPVGNALQSSSSSSSSTSTNKPPTGANARARGQTLITPPKRFANVAHFSPLGDVPLQLHSEFVRKVMNGGASESESDKQVREFYAETERINEGQVIGEGPFEFWRAQFASLAGRGLSKTTLNTLRGAEEFIRGA